MKHFDQQYAADVIRRLAAIRPESKPQWGRMTRAELIQHLGDSVRYSMGRAGVVQDQSNWLMQYIAGPLILNGIVPLPKNIKRPEAPMRPAQDDIETLQALLEEYLGLVQAGELEPPRHPVFGNIGVDDWAKMHAVHFEHHLRQFGA